MRGVYSLNEEIADGKQDDSLGYTKTNLSYTAPYESDQDRVRRLKTARQRRWRYRKMIAEKGETYTRSRIAINSKKWKSDLV